MVETNWETYVTGDISQWHFSSGHARFCEKAPSWDKILPWQYVAWNSAGLDSCVIKQRGKSCSLVLQTIPATTLTYAAICFVCTSLCSHARWEPLGTRLQFVYCPYSILNVLCVQNEGLHVCGRFPSRNMFLSVCGLKENSCKWPILIHKSIFFFHCHNICLCIVRESFWISDTHEIASEITFQHWRVAIF